MASRTLLAGMTVIMTLWLIACQSPARHVDYRSAALTGLVDRAATENRTAAPHAKRLGDHDLAADAPSLPVLSTDSTLADYVVYALLENPQLEAQFNRWKAALEEGIIEGTLPDPQFTYRYYIVRMGAGPDMEQRQTMELSQVFPWFGKLKLRSKRAEDEAAAQKQLFEAERLRVIYEVKDAYYEYYYLAQSIHNTRESRRLTEHMEGVARARYRADAVGHADVIRAQVELGRLDDRVRTQEDLRAPAMARLNAVLNRPADAELPWPGEIEPVSTNLDDSDILALAEEHNPQLKAMIHTIDREQRGIALARKEYFPDIMVGGEWMDMTMMPGMSGDSRDGWAVMVGVNVPIWWHKYAAGVRQASARHHAAQLERLDEVNALRTRLARALYELRDAERKIALYRDTLIPRAEASVGATEAAFRTGTATFLELLESVRVLLEFELSHQRALASQAQRLAEVEMWVGRNLPRTQHNEST